MASTPDPDPSLHAVYRLKPVLTAKRRLDRLAGFSRQILHISRRFPLLSIPLLPLQYLLRALSYTICYDLHRQGYPLPESICQRLRVSAKNTSA